MLFRSGLVPFFAAALGIWVFDDLLQALAQRTFLVYSSAILCFLAGTLWGENLPGLEGGDGAAILISNGVVLFVVFAVLTAQPVLAAGLLMLGHLAQLWYERQLSRPAWYRTLRSRLTFAAVFSHLVFIVGMMRLA